MNDRIVERTLTPETLQIAAECIAEKIIEKDRRHEQLTVYMFSDISGDIWLCRVRPHYVKALCNIQRVMDDASRIGMSPLLFKHKSKPLEEEFPELIKVKCGNSGCAGIWEITLGELMRIEAIGHIETLRAPCPECGLLTGIKLTRKNEGEESDER